MEDLPPPPAYQPEWDPNYRGPGAAASAPPGEEIELKPTKGQGGYSEGPSQPPLAGYPRGIHGGVYPPPPTSGYPSYPPPAGASYPPPSGTTYQPPSGGPYVLPYAPPSGTYPPPPGTSYPPPAGPGYPPAGYPPAVAPPQSFPGVQAQQNDADFRQPTVKLIDREDYQGEIMLGDEQKDALAAEEESENCVGWCRWVFWHGGFYVWLGFFIWQFIEKTKRQKWTEMDSPESDDMYNHKLFISAAVLMVFFYLCMLLETCCSQTDDYLANKMTMSEALEKIEKIRKSLPKLVWEAECYHTEYDYYHDSDGKQEKRDKKVVTRKEKYTFHYNELIDASPRFTVGKFNKGDFVRMEFGKSYGFVDEYSREAYTLEHNQFKDRNKNHDKEVEFEESFKLEEDFEDFVTVYWGDSAPNWCLMNRRLFWIFTLLGLSCVYRVWFKCRTKRTFYTFLKVMKK